MAGEGLAGVLRGRTVAVLCLNIGPYHVARLRAIAAALDRYGARLVAVELAAKEIAYPWIVARGEEPFEWRTLFGDQKVEEIPAGRQSKAVANALAEINPVAVQIPGWSHPFLRTALTWCRRRGVASVVAGNSTFHTGNPRRWHTELYKRWVLRGVGAAQGSGHSSRRYFASLGVPLDRIFLKINVVNNAFFEKVAQETREERARWGREYGVGGHFFFYPARILPIKNHFRLLDAYRAYAKRVGDQAWGLLLLGSGPLEAQVDERIAALGSPLVQRRPFTGIDEVARYYGLASALVFPSCRETWGNVVNEAEAAGLPILASTNVTATEHLLVEGCNGWMFDPYDVDQMADCLFRVASMPDAELARAGQASRQIVGDWDLKDHVAEFFKAIAVAAARRYRKPRWQACERGPTGPRNSFPGPAAARGRRPNCS